MSKRKKTKEWPQMVDYFAELRKAHPDRPVFCSGCKTAGEPHAFWCSERHGEEP